MKTDTIKNIVLTIFVSVALFSYIQYAKAATTPAVDKTFGYGLVRCDGVLNPDEPNRNVRCNFATLINGINYVIYRMIAISIPLAVVAFAYGGFLYMTGEQAKIKRAKDIFVSIGIGFAIMITGFFVVRTVVNWVVDPNTGATSLIQ